MAQNQVDLQPEAPARSTEARTSTVRFPASDRSGPDRHATLRASGVRASGDRDSSVRAREPHVVVATQNLPRMSGAIQALIRAGYLVTAYASPTRLLPRLHRMGSPVSLLVIDGGLAPAFARAAAIAASTLYASVPIILLATPQAARHMELVPSEVTLLSLPLSPKDLLATAASLAGTPGENWRDDPPDAA